MTNELDIDPPGQHEKVKKQQTAKDVMLYASAVTALVSAMASMVSAYSAYGNLTNARIALEESNQPKLITSIEKISSREDAAKPTPELPWTIEFKVQNIGSVDVKDAIVMVWISLEG